jgi:hypothetical protein
MEVSEQDGEIVISGPAGLHGAFLIEAAEASAHRILEVIRNFKAGTDGA